MVKLAERFVPLKTDAEKEGKDLAKQYKVRGFPTLIFVDSTGEEWGRISGYLPPDGFIQTVKPIIDAFEKWPKIQAAMKEKPDDPEANADYAFIMAMRGKIDEARKAYEKTGDLKGAAKARAANAIGDHYQTNEAFGTAIRWFEKADAAADSDVERAYARVSILVCYQSQGLVAEAKSAARKLLELKDVPKEYADMAKRVIGGE